MSMARDRHGVSIVWHWQAHCSHWSRLGSTHQHRPSRHELVSASQWRRNEAPPPVGMSTKQSSPDMVALSAWRWFSLKSRLPKKSLSRWWAWSDQANLPSHLLSCFPSICWQTAVPSSSGPFAFRKLHSQSWNLWSSNQIKGVQRVHHV